MNMQKHAMTLKDLELMKDTLYSDFDNFWSYNVLKNELENLCLYYLKSKEFDIVDSLVNERLAKHQFDIDEIEDDAEEFI